MKEEGLAEMLNSDLSSNKKLRKDFYDRKTFHFITPFLLFLLSFSLIYHSESHAVQSSLKLPIMQLEIEGLYSIQKKEFLNLLDIRIGGVLEREALRTGIKRVFLKGIFEDIIIEGNDELTKILIRVHEKKVIDRIEISGNNYFSKRFIIKNLNISEGERLNLLKIREGITSVRDQMKKRGFTDSQIAYTIVFLEDNRCSLNLQVKEGEPDIIKKIIISEPSDTVKSYLNMSEGDIFDITKLEKFENKVLNYYKKQRYIDTYLKHTFQNGILTFTLKSGNRLDINFIGNDSVSTKKLMEEVVFYDINEFSNDLVEEMKSRLISLYHKEGFPFADVTPIISSGEEYVVLDVYIFEGDRYKVKDLLFTGASIPDDRLKDILISRKGEYYNIDIIESDIETLTEFYHSMGYLDVIVSEPDIKLAEGTAEIEFFIYEGDQTTIAKISVKNNKSFSDEELLSKISLKTGNPYNEIDVSDSRRQILSIYNKSGFIKARVTTESTFEDNYAGIVFLIEEGNITFFGKNVIVGNERTKSKVIERELQEKEGNPFNYSLSLKEKQQIQRLGLFTDVDIKLSDYEIDKKRDVIFYLDEANHGAMEFGAGYGEYEKYRLFIDLSYRNLWGMNRIGSFRAELSSLEQRFILIYTEPWFLDRKIALKTLILYENRKEKSLDTKDVLYKLRRNTASAGLEQILNENIKAAIYYDFSVVKTSDLKPDIILSKEDVGTLIISGFRPSLIYDTRDNPFEPGKGILAGFSFKIASGLFFSETDFAKLIFYGNKYLRLSERIVLALSLRGGIAKGFASTTELPIVERFFLGGRTTVRGYAQDTLGPKGTDGNPTGGNAFAMGNMEMRFYFGKGIGVVGFLDSGNVWQKINQADISGFKFTTGIGLRYQTPAGPLRIDYGHKLNRETGESKGELHFSIGHAF